MRLSIPDTIERRGDYADELHDLRGRRGISRLDAIELLKQPTGLRR